MERNSRPLELGDARYGTPIYTNITYPFKRDYPRVTETPDDHSWTAFDQRDPVGSYRREFTVPADWAGRQVYLLSTASTRHSTCGSMARRSDTARTHA